MSTDRSAAGIWTIVVAGGGGTRYGRPKQFEVLAGRRVVDWSVAAARTVSEGIVLVVPATDLGVAVDGVDRIVAGGATRSASVRAGLAAVPDSVSVVLVHDAARPAASPALFARVVDAVRAGVDGVVPGVPVTDSLRDLGGGAVDRARLVAVQTPQGFDAGWLRRAHADEPDASDDATVVEAIGGRIGIVDGETTNIKLTHPADRASLERTLAGAPDPSKRGRS